MKKTLVLLILAACFALISCATVASGNRDSNEKEAVKPTTTLTQVTTVKPVDTATPDPTIAVTAVPQKITDSERFYPLSLGNELYFRAYKKENKDEIIKVKGEVRGIESRDGEEFFYMYAPKVDIRYLLKRDDKGVYMKIIKYPFLFFGNIEVTMNPPLNFFKFPAKVGMKWEEHVKAEATFMFIPISRDIHGKFEIIGKEVIKTGAGKLEAYHVRAAVNQGSDEKDVKVDDFWYAKGMGYTRADTTVHYADLVGYKILDEETGKWNVKLPENPEDYK